jgi:hypothetical protein
MHRPADDFYWLILIIYYYKTGLCEQIHAGSIRTPSTLYSGTFLRKKFEKYPGIIRCIQHMPGFLNKSHFIHHFPVEIKGYFSLIIYSL